MTKIDFYFYLLFEYSMKKYLLPLLLALTLLAGCGRHDYAQHSPAMAAMAPAAADAEAGSGEESNRYMAYEHFIEMDAAEDKVATLYEAALAACKAAAKEGCVLLESRISTGRYPYASLKLRSTSAGIAKVVEVLQGEGKITNQSTTAEDLSGPIRDSAKELEMLLDYRARLENLRTRPSNDMEALITLNKELAQVQKDIESISGTKAHLTQRVETEILNINISSNREASFWRPISQSLSEFGNNLSSGISSVITTIAILAPWVFMLLALVWAVRKWWQRRKRKLQA